MSKSKKGKTVGDCLACGARVKRKQPACKRCGHRNPLFAPKVAQGRLGFIGKSARPNVVPISARPVCHCGNQGKRTDRHCTTCGLPYGISKMAVEGMALKATGVTPSGYWADQAARESDPEQREILRDRAIKMAAQDGREASPEALARAWGFASLQDAAMKCTSGEARSYFLNAYYNNGGAA